MKRISLFFSFLLLGALVTPAAFAATSGTSNVTLAASGSAQIQVVDNTLTLSPTSVDYDNGYVQASGASGLRVNVMTNSTTGLVLMVRCSDASPQIALADLLVRTQTAPGTGGTSMASYTPITSSNQTLWTTGQAQHAWQSVVTDVKVQNLFNYDDGISAGTTNYTNTLTYTVVVQ